MIEVIVCFTDPLQKTALEHNVKQSVGEAVCFTAIDNRSNQWDLFSAYDAAIRQSRAEILVCCHQDILIHTNNWGQWLRECFEQNPELGLIGVAGGSAHSRAPGGWETAAPLCHRLIHILQHNEAGECFLDSTLDEKQDVYPAVVLDGVFLAFRHNVFDTCSFLRNDLHGFHGYDLDICLQLNQAGWALAVTPRILLEHFSLGKPGKEYVKNILRIHTVYRKWLPVFSGVQPTSEQIREYEVKSLLLFLYTMKKANMPMLTRWKVLAINFSCLSYPFSRTSLAVLILGITGSDFYRIRQAVSHWFVKHFVH